MMIIEANRNSTENVDILKATIKSLESELKGKERRIGGLQHFNSALSEDKVRLEQENNRLKNAALDYEVKKKRYQSVIIKMHMEGASTINEGEPPKDKEKVSKYPRQKKEYNEKKKGRCKYENVGRCRDNVKCPYFHPTGICGHFSTYGSCPNKLNCRHRHPTGLCTALS